MIETILPLKIPPGIVYNGTTEERAGRWINGNFVRFTKDGVPIAIGSTAALTVSNIPGGGVATSAWTWFITSGGNQAVVCGKQTKLYVFTATNGVAVDITPGTPSDFGTLHSSWAFTNVGSNLMFTRAHGPGFSLGGPLWQWIPGTGAATVVTNSPSITHGVVYTPESFLMVIRDDNIITWASQGTTTTWTPTGTNSAGALTVPTSGTLLRLFTLRGETFVLSDKDLWRVNYIGGDLVYGIERVGEHCGLFGPNAITVAGDTAYWMGARGFFQFDGFVRPVDCPLVEIIFGDFNSLADGRAFAVSVPIYNELWFQYATTAGNTPNKCVRFNTETGAWYLDPLTRSAGIDAVWPPQVLGTHTQRVPVLFDANGDIPVAHETPGVTATAFIESGPIELGDGEQVMRVQKLIPDGAVTGDDITLYAGGFPGQAETTIGPTAITAGAGPVDVRFSARYVRFKQTLEAVASRIGVPKLGVIPEGKR